MGVGPLPEQRPELHQLWRLPAAGAPQENQYRRWTLAVCVEAGALLWQWVKKETCKEDLRAYGVNESSPMISRALLYGFSPGSCHGVNTQVRAVMHRIPGSCKPF